MNRSFEQRFANLRDRLAEFFRDRAAHGGAPAPMLAEVAGTLAQIAAPAERPAPFRLPGCRHYAGALAAARCGPVAGIAEAFDALEPDMAWTQTAHYRAALGDAYMDNYAYTQLVGGWDSMVAHDKIACGLFIIGPGRHYPEHHHEAEEIYFPLSGDTLWSLDGAPATPREPGATIHNPPWQRHAMTTRETPLFAFYCWRGPVTDQAQLIA
jgi:quercetin dioxygenase-like cupin family protein